MKVRLTIALLFIALILCAAALSAERTGLSREKQDGIAATRAGAPAQATHDSDEPTPEPAVIRSQAALQRYLDDTPLADSPLGQLSPAARQRFLDSLRFSDNGLVGYGFEDLQAELSSADIQAILNLFGAQTPAFLLAATASTTPAERRARANVADAGAACTTSSPCSAIARGYLQLQAVEDSGRGMSEREHARAIAHAYDTLIQPSMAGTPLATVSDPDLELLYRAANLVAFYTFAPRYVDAMTRLVDALQARGLASSRHYSEVYAAYVADRRFDAARALAATHHAPDMESLPEFRDRTPLPQGVPTIWTVDPKQRLLLRQPVDLHAPAQVVVVAHPSCHFTQNAVHDIEVDPLFGPIFAAHATWLAPQTRKLDVDLLQQWNRAHPDTPMRLAYDRNEWPMINSWATPTFYFFSDGKLVTTVTGWPREGHRDGLRAALQQVGLLP